MTFCVECGAEGTTFQGVCAKDFVKQHALIRAPEYIDVVRCAHCGKLEIAGRWEERDLDLAILDLIGAAAERGADVARVQFTYDMRPQDARNVALTVKAVCTVGPWELVDSFHSRLRIHDGQCPTCSRQKGSFFVGTVQIRAEGRPLTPEEVRRAQGIVARSPSGKEFVTEIKEVRGGIDVKVSSNPFARRLARDLAHDLGGSVKSSATLHTQREGRDQYRSTFAVRLPSFRKGDVVLWRHGRYRVVGIGDLVRLEHTETAQRLQVRPREMRTARVVRE